jgi:hypothetical protein
MPTYDNSLFCYISPAKTVLDAPIVGLELFLTLLPVLFSGAIISSFVSLIARAVEVQQLAGFHRRKYDI